MKSHSHGNNLHSYTGDNDGNGDRFIRLESERTWESNRSSPHYFADFHNTRKLHSSKSSLQRNGREIGIRNEWGRGQFAMHSSRQWDGLGEGKSRIGSQCNRC